MLRQARAGGLGSAQQPAAQPLRQATTTEDAFESGDYPEAIKRFAYLVEFSDRKAAETTALIKKLKEAAKELRAPGK